MKKFRPVESILMYYITCGIFPIYMWTVMTKNSNKIASAKKIEVIMEFIPAMLLGFVTCGIYPVVWFYKFMKQQVELSIVCGGSTHPISSPILLLLLSIVPIYGVYLLCDNYNRNVYCGEHRVR